MRAPAALGDGVRKRRKRGSFSNGPSCAIVIGGDNPGMDVESISSTASIMHASRHAAATVLDAGARAAFARRLTQMRLQEIDAEVRAHEHAHVAALGKGVIHYDTVVGSDGQAYAVGGSVAVDLQPVPGDPEATVRKAKMAVQAALAVGQPSAADMRVAAEAYELEEAAQRQLAEEQAGGGTRTWWA
jgi:hypothetical protein